MAAQERFEGTIGRTLAESTPWWPSRPHPGDDAPNVVVILIDDLGFSHFGCYGSTIDTPNIDRLAAGGLRYTNFHVTPLCSPTRRVAAHRPQPPRGGHAGGVPTSTPASRTCAGTSPTTPRRWPRCCATRATRRSRSASGTSARWSTRRRPARSTTGRASAASTASTASSTARPTSSIPSSIYDNHLVDPPRTVEDGYHLSEDLVDHAIGFVARHQVDPARPAVLPLPRVRRDPRAAPGARTSTSRSTAGVRRRAGTPPATNGSRASTQMGLMPAGHRARAAQPRRRAVGRRCPRTHQRLAARLQEAFAGFLDHTDAQIGRLVDDARRRSASSTTR